MEKNTDQSGLIPGEALPVSHYIRKGYDLESEKC